ncbi:DUF262 domain-containing protein [Brevibacillus sp. NPDC058079]|uniref:DUF262 domain-containing protein n=1 Tax=Brevibacillus sp. NPDC058079 TaxID=3346330 RepID=UPI0036EB15DD
MAHIFKSFLRTDWVNMDTVSVVVEKNTNKAVKEVIQLLDELFAGNEHRVIQVDARNIRDNEKMGMLVGYSLYRFRNIDSFSFRSVKIDLPFLGNVEINESYRELFAKLRRKGGNWEVYANLKDIDWSIINSIINEETDAMVSRLRVIQKKYELHQEKIANPLPKLKDFRHRWNFHIRQYDLLSLYKSCFNEVDQILAPASCYNPNPSFQRELVWNEEKKQAFIHSILDEIPIGSFYVNRTKTYDPVFTLGEGFGGLVWDGKQRLHALHDFILGKYSVLVNGNPMYYHDNPGFFMLKFSSCSITTYESNFDTLREIIEAYVVINSAQVKHTDEDLKKAINYLKQQGQPSN